jgi:hypothetical protein
MSQHVTLGDISIPVGSYTTKEGTVKKRYRNLGTLMKTVEDDGTERHWMRIHADALHASLYALASAFRQKGDDCFSLNVFPPRDEAQKPKTEPAQADENGVPF